MRSRERALCSASKVAGKGAPVQSTIARIQSSQRLPMNRRIESSIVVGVPIFLMLSASRRFANALAIGDDAITIEDYELRKGGQRHIYYPRCVYLTPRSISRRVALARTRLTSHNWSCPATPRQDLHP